MAHHKRRRAKHQRAGCMLCKPWKGSGHHPEAAESEKFSDHRRRLAAKEAIHAGA